MSEEKQSLLRQIPSVDAVLQEILQSNTSCGISRSFLTQIIRVVIGEVREEIVKSKKCSVDNLGSLIVSRVRKEIDELTRPFYRKVINAAGIVLHTGLGRAVLAKSAINQIRQEVSGYSLLQVSIEDGKRSNRDVYVEKLLKLLTSAEAATVVNNNAAATAVVLNTIANGKEVIVSRGQLVEIGGSYRLPDVMAFSGAKLVEVGTTNKTHLRDYENAITEETAAILRVHPSNFKIQGFTSETSLKDIVGLAHSNDLVVYDDVGAGSLVDFSKYGFKKEPTLIESIETGSDVVTSSGDKLIGASQAGIILGRAEIIKQIRKNQFARIVRVDKLTLAVLESTLKMFLHEEGALEELPTLRMLLRKYDSIKKQATGLAEKIKSKKLGLEIEVVDGFSQTGSGSLPIQNLKTSLITIKVDSMSSIILANRLRHYKVPVFTRIQDERVLLDSRTLMEGDEKIVVEALTEIMSS